MTNKNKIIKASYDVIMKYGVRSISMDDIAHRCGISKKTLYQVVDNKKHLIEELIMKHTEMERENIIEITSNSSTALEAMIMLGRHIVKFFRSMSPTLVFDLRKYYPSLWNKVEEEHIGFVFETIKNNLIKGKEEGYYAASLNPEIIARIYMESSLSLANNDQFSLDHYDKSSLMEALVMYHLRGIVSDKGRQILSTLEIE